MKRILLTGATGFIGSFCLPLLLSKGYEVHGVTLTKPKKMASGVNWHMTNLLDTRQLLKLMEEVRPTHLLHFAWYVVPGKCWDSVENFSWVQSSLDLLQTFSRYGGQRVVMAGTCAEYDWNYSHCIEQETPLSPTTLYGTCKHALRLMFDTFTRQKSLSGAWGRIFFLYGPNEHPQRLVPYVIRSLLSGEPAQCSHGNQLRDYLYVKDVAEAFIALLESNIQGPVNIASGHPIALKEIVNKIGEKLNRKELIKLGARPAVVGEPNLLVGDVDRLSNEVGWAPKFNLDSGLEETIDWWRNRPSIGKIL